MHPVVRNRANARHHDGNAGNQVSRSGLASGGISRNAPQGRREGRDVLISIRRRSSQSLRQHLAQRAGQTGAGLASGARSRQQLVQDCAQGVDIAADIGPLAAQRLRARILGSQRAPVETRQRSRFRVGLQQACHAKIQQAHFALPGHQDVRRFQVAVNDATRVRVADGVEYLQEQIDACPDVVPLRVAPGDEWFALHVFHRDVRRAIGFDAGIVEPRDTREFQRREDPAFAREALRHLHRDMTQARNLERHEALERSIGTARQPDFRHAAGTQRPQQLVCAQPFTRMVFGRHGIAGTGVHRGRLIERTDGSHVRIVGLQCFAQRLHQRQILARQACQPGTPRSGAHRQRLVEQLTQACHLLCRQTHVVLALHRCQQHHARLQPQALDGSLGDLQGFGNFLFAVAAEVAHLHHLREARIHLRE